MSTRTILELNHDFIATMDADDWEEIKQMCLHKDTRWGYHLEGVRILGERHHSETLKLEVK